MSELTRISDLLKRAFDGDAWHGPGLVEVLADVDSTLASARPIDGVHSIWEIVLHLRTWESVVARRLQAERFTVGPAEDWPAMTDKGETDWRASVESLRDGHLRLRAAIRDFDENRLEGTVPGQTYTFYVMVHGVIQHDLYHAGQIALLKKAGR